MCAVVNLFELYVQQAELVLLQTLFDFADVFGVLVLNLFATEGLFFDNFELVYLGLQVFFLLLRVDLFKQVNLDDGPIGKLCGQRMPPFCVQKGFHASHACLLERAIEESAVIQVPHLPDLNKLISTLFLVLMQLIKVKFAVKRSRNQCLLCHHYICEAFSNYLFLQNSLARDFLCNVKVGRK